MGSVRNRGSPGCAHGNGGSPGCANGREVLQAALTETEVLRAALTKAVLEETEVVGAEEQKQGRYDSSSSHHRLPTGGNMLRREGALTRAPYNSGHLL